MGAQREKNMHNVEVRLRRDDASLLLFHVLLLWLISYYHCGETVFAVF